jgi:hypothetical protein
MSVSPTTEAFMADAWNAALNHANVPADEFHLLPVPGAPAPGGNKAACYPPRRRLWDEEDDLLRGPILDEANLPEHRNKHRVAIYADVNPADPVALAILGATLRHEIRHGEQRIACGQSLFELTELLDYLLDWKLRDLRGGVFYQFKPVELDANAAAASFLRASFPGEIEGVLDTDDAPARAITN